MYKKLQGNYDRDKSNIYILLYPEEFESILVHEMIHLIVLEHNEIFLEEAKRISNMGLPININCKHYISKVINEWRICNDEK